MISQFYGEFLFNPCPLELSMSYCSHGCAYCFACARGMREWAGLKSVERNLSKVFSTPPANLREYLIQNKYPLVLSNRSDPFARSNRKDILPLLSLLKARGVPVCIQTKGGEGLEQAAGLLDRSLFYFTICFLNEDLRQSIEPNAPSIEDRLQYIDTVRALGHEVVVGVTPICEAWLPLSDFETLCGRLAAAGVRGLYLQGLHLGREHKLSPRAKEAMAAALPDAKRRRATPAQFEYFLKCCEIAQAHGLDCYGPGNWQRTGFMDAFRDVYEHTFPVTDDFINWVWENKEDGELVTFEEYGEVMLPLLPAGVWKLGDYLRVVARQLCPPGFERNMTFEEYLKVTWSNPKHVQTPARRRLLAYEGLAENGETWDTNGEPPVMRVNKQGFKVGQLFTD